MTATSTPTPVRHEPQLLGWTVVVIGGSMGHRARTTLPVRRVVGRTDIAALAVHLMTNTAVTGATFDIDGGQQLIEG